MADKNLTVKIRGDNTGLSRSLRQSKAGVTKFGGFLKTFGSKFGLLGAGLVGTAAGGLGAGLSIKVFTGAIEEVDKLTKLGKQFGITTEGVQKFKAAATLTGTNLQQLLKGFGQLSKAIIQFSRDGTGPGAKVFGDLGLSADTLKQSFAKGPIEVLKTFGEALNKVEDPLIRSALLEEVLGARNKELAVVLEDVSNVFAGIDKQFRELDLGLTKEETDSVELFRDTWAEIGDIIDNRVLKRMAQLSGELQPFAAAVKAMTEAVVKGGFERMSLAIGGVGDELADLAASSGLIGTFLRGTPIGQGILAQAPALKTIGAIGAGDLSFDKVRAFFARGLTGAFDLLEVPPSFGDKIVAAVRGSNLEEILPGLEAPRPGTGTINGRRIADIMAEISTKLGSVPPFPGALGGLPAAGTGTINGRSIEGILAEDKKQSGLLEKLNTTVEKSFFKNERTGVVIGVAAK